MSQAETSKPPPSRLKTPSKGLARWETLQKVLKELASLLGLRLEIDGADEASQTSDGLRFKIKPGAVAGDHPWKGVPGSPLTCLGGMVNSIEHGTVPVAAGEGWCYLRLTFTLDIEDNFVHGGQLTSAVVYKALTIPADSGGVFHLGLFRVTASGSIIQSATRNIFVSACDDGSGTGVARLNVMQS